jgi:hypothetical protein
VAGGGRGKRQARRGPGFACPHVHTSTSTSCSVSSGSSHHWHLTPVHLSQNPSNVDASTQASTFEVHVSAWLRQNKISRRVVEHAADRALMPPVVHAFALASLTLKVPDKMRSRPLRHRFRRSPSLPAPKHSLSLSQFALSSFCAGLPRICPPDPLLSARHCALTSESHLNSLLWVSSCKEHLSLSSRAVAALSIL